MKIMRCVLLVLICSLSVSQLHAQNLPFLEDAAFGHFSEADITLMKQAVNNSLENAPDGQKHEWRNPESPASGIVQPQNSFDFENTKCRKLMISNHFKEKKGNASFVYCKQPDGKWKINTKAKPADSLPEKE